MYVLIELSQRCLEYNYYDSVLDTQELFVEQLKVQLQDLDSVLVLVTKTPITKYLVNINETLILFLFFDFIFIML